MSEKLVTGQNFSGQRPSYYDLRTIRIRMIHDETVLPLTAEPVASRR